MKSFRRLVLSLPLALALLAGACAPPSSPPARPAAVPSPSPSPRRAAAQADCYFKDGFARFSEILGPEVVGECLENERPGQDPEVIEQRTTRGLLSYRAGDDKFVFTDDAVSHYGCPGRLYTAPRGLPFECPSTTSSPLGLPGIALPTRPPSPTPTPVVAPAACPEAVNWRAARAHLGSRLVLEGPVVGIFSSERLAESPLLLHLGSVPPDPIRVTVVIPFAVRGLFPEPPEQLFADQRVCVTGQLELVQNVPNVTVESPDALVVAP